MVADVLAAVFALAAICSIARGEARDLVAPGLLQALGLTGLVGCSLTPTAVDAVSAGCGLALVAASLFVLRTAGAETR